jgi:hypothetical protein
VTQPSSWRVQGPSLDEVDELDDLRRIQPQGLVFEAFVDSPIEFAADSAGLEF